MLLRRASKPLEAESATDRLRPTTSHCKKVLKIEQTKNIKYPNTTIDFFAKR